MTLLLDGKYRIDACDFSDEHYKDVVAVHNGVWTDYPVTVEQVERHTRLRNHDHLHFRFLVYEVDRDICVASTTFGHNSGAYHPHKFFCDISVLPDFRNQGLGTSIFNWFLEKTAEYELISIEMDTRSNRDSAIALLDKHGFELKLREYSSKLNMAEFKPDSFPGYAERMAAGGITVRPLSELDINDVAFQKKAYEALNIIDQDVPWHDEQTTQPFEQWQRRFVESPERINECFLLAFDETDEIVGVTMLFQSKASQDTIFTGLTGVKREHRRKGIAMGLKLQALTYVRDNIRTADGRHVSVITENEENNPMYKINERLGFKRQPDFLIYVKKLKEEPNEAPAK